MVDDIPLPSGTLLVEHPWLLDANSCCLTWTADTLRPDEAGVWAVGNGYIFAHAGLALPFNRLMGITGPTYQTDGHHRVEGAFGDAWFELRSQAGALLWPRQQIWRPRQSGVLVTRAHDGTTALVTVDFAPPGMPVLVRIVEIWGARSMPDQTVLVLRLPAGVPLNGAGLLEAEHRPGQVLVAGPLDGRAAARRGALTISIGDQRARENVVRFAIVLAAGEDTDAAAAHLRSVQLPIRRLEETRAFWQSWLAGTETPPLWAQRLPGPTSDVALVRDLIEMTKVNLKMQQALPGGGVSPMVHFKGTWARDNNGAIRAFLAIGAKAEARALLEYYYAASVALGEIPNRAPLDLDVAGVDEPGDWSRIPVPHAEVPSFIVLQHRWWLEAGGDADLVRRHWAYLRRCATGQRLSPEGLLPFHGDETYLHGALYAIFPERCGWPNDLIAEDGRRDYTPWSLEATAAYVVAQEAMGWMSERIGRPEERAGYLVEAVRVRRTVERRFWLERHGWYAPALYPLSGAPHEPPFAPVNLALLWLGYGHPAALRARANVSATISQIGFTAVAPRCEYNVGMTPGYLLWNLLATRSELAPFALATLVAMASVAGEWAEVYGPHGRPHGGYDQANPNRLRPWEGGINLDAIYRYYRNRRPQDEPEERRPGSPERRQRARGPRRSAPFMVGPMPTPERLVVVTADADEVAAARTMIPHGARLTIIEPAAIFTEDYFTGLLFERESGKRRVETLVLGASALAADRRSLKPSWFWELPEVVAALRRFQAAGGQVVRPAAQ